MNIIVLAGGYSNERDVSLSSGGSICRALRERGHNAYLLDAFLGLEKAPENLVDVFTLPGGGLEIATGIQTSEPDLDALWASRPGDSPSYLGPNVLELCSLADITFLALHGGLGENGKLQAAFDTLGIRYTGPDSLGCALSMDKGVTKDLFHSAGVPTPYGTHISRKNKDISLESLQIPLPLVVKPCSGGSSIGVHFVHTEEEFREAMSPSSTGGSTPAASLTARPSLWWRSFPTEACSTMCTSTRAEALPRSAPPPPWTRRPQRRSRRQACLPLRLCA